MIKNKKILIVFIISILSLILMPNISNAGLQANKGGTSLTVNWAEVFFESIRDMEELYGTLGTNAVIDKENGTYLDNSNNRNRLSYDIKYRMGNGCNISIFKFWASSY